MSLYGAEARPSRLTGRAGLDAGGLVCAGPPDEDCRLPVGPLDDHFTNDKIIDSAWLSCHKPPHARKLGNHEKPYVGPTFVETEQYIGRGAARACAGKTDGEFDPSCGTPYIHYQFPRKPFATFPDVAIMNSSTTGVGKGGEARGLFQVSPSNPIQTVERDSIGYIDPNVPCKQEHVAKWFHLRYRGVTGWFVATRHDVDPRKC